MTTFLLLSLLTAATASPTGLAAMAAEGDCPGVIEAWGEAKPADIGTRLAVGRCLGAQGRIQEALALLPAPDPMQAMSPWVRWVRAQVMMGTDLTSHALPQGQDQAQAILAELDGVSLPGEQGLQVRLMRARCLVALGERLLARPDLRELLSTSVAAEARYLLALAAEQDRDHEPAIATYRATWARHATTRWADLSAGRLEAMGSPVPDLETAEGRALALERFETLREASHAGEALSLLKTLAAAEEPATVESPAWRRRTALACFHGRDYRCAVDAFAALGSPSSDTPAETLFLHALATSRVGDYPGAAEIYRTLHQRFPQQRRGDLASFKIPFLDYDAGALPEAIRGFAEHMARLPSSRHTDEALWFIGWSHWRLEQPAEATRAWSRLLERFPSSSLAPGAMYWTARAASGGQAMRQGLEGLLRRYPESGHAWLARWRIGTLPSPPEGQAPALRPWPQASREPSAEVVDTLLEAGLHDLALDAMGPLVATAGDGATRSALAHRLVWAGDAAAARRILGGGCGGRQNAHLCQPLLHREIVARVVGDSGLDPLLPYAIMQAESGFKPRVTSPVGAMGLMQLMPEVGERLHARRYPHRPYVPEDLYLGAYNAALGTAELVRLWDRYRERGLEQPLPMVIAAYNAGEEAVDRWLAEAGEAPELDMFSENIGYTETRRYVKRVLGYLMAYHRAHGGG